MRGRTLGIAFLILASAAGGVDCSSAQTESAASAADSASASAAAAETVGPEASPPAAPAVAASAERIGAAGEPQDRAAAALSPPSPAPAPRAPAPRSASERATPSPAPRPIPGPLPSTPTVSPPAEDEAVRARQEITVTDRLLAAVRKKVGRSFNKKARQDFVIAMGRQREAREAFDENFFARADRLTLEAREMARQIAYRLGPPQDDPDYVSMTLDRTDDALKRAHEVIARGGGDDDRRRMEALAEDQEAAKRRYKESDYRGAYEATRRVRDGVLTLLRECDDLPVPASTAERALKRASRALEHAESELGERRGDTARRLEREARDQLAKARAAYARKNYRDTLLHSKLVERNLELAVAAQRSATNRSG